MLLEARGKLGGRVCTARHASAQLEHGAQWIHGTNSAFALATAELWRGRVPADLPSAWAVPGTAPLPRSDVQAAQRWWYAHTETSEFDEAQVVGCADSVGRAAATAWQEAPGSERPNAAALSALDALQCSIDGCSSTAVQGVRSSAAYDELDEANIRPAHGWSQLLQDAFGVAVNEKCQANTAVERIIVREDGGVLVHASTPAGPAAWRAAAVLLTAPLPVLQRACGIVPRPPAQFSCPACVADCGEHEAAPALGALRFEPPLPARKVQALRGIVAGASEKVFLIWEAPWWQTELGGLFLAWGRQGGTACSCSDSAAWHDAVPPACSSLPAWTRSIVWWSLHVRDGVSYATGWLAGRGARHMAHLPAEQVRDDALACIRAAFTDSALTPGLTSIPEPVACQRSQWSADPHIGLGYSYQYPGADTTARSALAAAEPPLFFAGEATHSTQYGTVHGAVASGQRAAAEVAAYLTRAGLT